LGKNEHSKQLIKLQKLWYEKLKHSGFRDIEVMDSDGSLDSPMMLQTFSGLAYRYDESVREYYLMASHYLFSGRFESNLAKHCWQMHADGQSYREIVRSLPENGFHPYQLFYVQGLIRKIQTEMYLAERVIKKEIEQLELFDEI
jgi:hypothetical protein